MSPFELKKFIVVLLYVNMICNFELEFPSLVNCESCDRGLVTI